MFWALLILPLVVIGYFALDFAYKAGYREGQRAGAVKMYKYFFEEEPDEEFLMKILLFKIGGKNAGGRDE